MPALKIDRYLAAIAIFIGVAADFRCVGDEPVGGPDYQRDVVPVLRSHCWDCHGAENQEAELRLDTLSTDVIQDRAAAETWHEVLNVLSAGEMPPEDSAQLSSTQIDVLTRWVRSKVDEAVAAAETTDGRVVIRRLNGNEYNHTMHDLLGMEMDYTRDLPPDAVSSDGFTNNGRYLQMSAFHLESYLDTARRAMDRVIVLGPPPERFEHEFTASNLTAWLGEAEKSNRLGRQQEFLVTMKEEYPETGDFRVRVKLTAELKPKVGFPLLEVSVGYRPDTQILMREFDLVEITSEKQQVFEFRGRMEEFPLPVRGQGKYPGLVIRVRNVYDDGTPLPKGERNKFIYPDEEHLPKLNIESVGFDGPVFDHWPPVSHRNLLFASPLSDQQDENDQYVEEVLTRFMIRAFRRPARADEVTRMMDHYRTIRPEFPTFEETMRETLAMVLIQPSFLYLVEPGAEEKREITDWELASRLSYFLWSTMPDQQLMDLAAARQLKTAAVLRGQVDRMLKDSRSFRFVQLFTDQWLQLGRLENIAIDSERYAGFDDRLKAELRLETNCFFAELLDSNLSALNLLNSDFIKINERIAKHYGIDGVLGNQMRCVEIDEGSVRGGLLGQASILISNSTGADSHPVRRAVWIRDRLLNDPPAPPPPDVPSLEQADPKFHQLSIREQLALHRKKVACDKCHHSIDPWGIALENFDAIGLWRAERPGKPGATQQDIAIDASDELPGGVRLEGVGGLKEYLLGTQKDKFARSLVTRLLTYALGRQMELSDLGAIDKLTGEFSDNDYRLRELIFQIVDSQPFQSK